MGFDIQTFWRALVSADYLNGAFLALALGAAAMVIGVLLGFLLALARLSDVRALRAFAAGYIGLFRAIPTLLILLVVWNALPQLFPALRADWFSPFIAALISLSVVEAAYMAEIIRAALLSVAPGQRIAGRALGMMPVQVMMKVIVPQATRVAIPPTGSEFINTIKYTSLASVISLRELLTSAQVGVSTTFRFAEYYAAAAIYYLVIVVVLTYLQGRLEARYVWTSKKIKASKTMPALEGSRA